MELARLIAALSDPAAYPDPSAVAAVEVRQTHISVVFLAGTSAYKIKKPLVLPFLDYGTPERRRHYCEEEVRLNRRLAPSVYLGVVPVTADGAIRMGGRGEAIEWAVEMVRLPEEATLGRLLDRGAIGEAELSSVARRIADFHARAEAGPKVAAFGRLDVVAANARANFAEAAGQAGVTVSEDVLGRLAELTERALAALGPAIEGRAARGVPRDGHGDLRLDHIYLFPGRPAPDDLVIVDAIEFADRFRCADPVADLAFLVMDLILHGRRDLADILADSYLRASGDQAGRALLPFYVAYRAAVRGKVEGVKAAAAEVSEADRAEAKARARAQWLLALGELEEPGRRPCLVLVGGLPGAGKSTLARGLADRAGFATIRSDEVRKELAGARPARAGPSAFEAGIYTPEWTERTYAECLRRAEALLFERRRVLIDASFRSESSRRLFLDRARRWGVPALLLICRAAPGVVRARLHGRRGDVSDAGWSIYLRAAELWESPGPAVEEVTRIIDTDGGAEGSLSLALDLLRSVKLLGPEG